MANMEDDEAVRKAKLLAAKKKLKKFQSKRAEGGSPQISVAKSQARRDSTNSSIMSEVTDTIDTHNVTDPEADLPKTEEVYKDGVDTSQNQKDIIGVNGQEVKSARENHDYSAQGNFHGETENYQAKVDNLTRQIDSMQLHIDQQSAELSREKAAKDDLVKSAESMTMEAKSTQQRLEQDLKTAHADLDSTRTEMTNKIESLENELKVVSQKLADQKVHETKASEEYRDFKEKHDMAEKAKEALEREVETLKATIKEHEASHSSIQESQSQLVAKANSSRSDFERKLIQAQAQLQRAHKEHKASEELLKIELTSVKKQLDEQLQLYEKSSTDQSSLQQVSEKAERDKADFLSKIQDLETELMRSKNQQENTTKSHDAAISEYKSREEALKSKLMEAEVTLKQIQEENETRMNKLLEEQQAKLQTSEEELQAVKKELEVHKLESQQSLDEHAAKIDQFEQARDSTQQAMSRKDKEIEKIQEDHQSLQQKHEEVSKALAENQQLANQIPGLETQISELLKKEEEASKHLIAEKAVTERLQATLDSMNETLASSADDHDAKLQNLIMSHSNEKMEWYEATSNLKNQISEIEGLTETLRQTIGQQEQTIKEKEQQLSNLKDNVDDARAITEKAGNDKDILQKEHIALKREYELVTKQKEEAQSEIEQHMASITDLKESKENVSFQLDKALQDFEAYRIEAQKSQEAESSKHREAMDKAAQVAVDREKELQSTLQKLETEIEQHVSAIADLRDSHTDTSSQLEKALQDFETYRADALKGQEVATLKHSEDMEKARKEALNREQKLQAKVQQLENEIEQHISNITELNESKADTSSQLEKALQEFETYRADALKRQEASEVEHREAVDRAAQEALRKEQELQTSLKMLENEIEQHVTNITQLRDSEAHTTSQLENSLQEFEAYRANASKNQEEAESRHRTAMDKAAQDALNREQELHAAVQKLEKDIEQINFAKSKVDEQKADLEVELGDLKSAASDLESQNLQHSQTIKELESDNAKATAHSEQLSQQLQAIKVELQQANDTAAKEAEAKEKSIHALQVQVSKHEENASNRLQQLEEATHKLQSINTECDKYRNDIDQLKSQNQSLEADIKIYIASKTGLEDQITDMTSQTAKLEQHLTNSNNDKEALDKEISRLKAAREEEVALLKSQLEKSKEEAKSLEIVRLELVSSLDEHRKTADEQAKTLSSELEELKANEMELNGEIQQLESKLGSSQTSIDSLRRQLEETELAKQELEISLRNELTLHQQTAESNQKATAKEIERLTGEHSNVSEKLVAAEALVALEQSKLVKHQAEHEKALLEERDKMQSLVKKMNDLQNTYKKKVADLEHSRDEAEHQITLLQQDVERRQTSMNELQSKHTVAEEQLATLQKQHKELNQTNKDELERFVAEITQYQTKEKELEDQKHSLSVDVTDARKASISLQSELEDVKREYEQAMLDSKYKITNIENEKASVERDLTSARAKIDTLTSEHTQAIDQLRSELEDTVSLHKSQLQQLHEAQVARDRQISQFQHQISTHTEEITKLHADRAKYENLLFDAQALLVETRSSAEAELRNTIAKNDEQVKKLQSKLDTKMTEFEEMQASLQSAIDNQSNKNSKLQHEKSTLSEQLKESNSQIDALSHELSIEKDNVSKLKDNLNSLQEQATQYNQRIEDLTARGNEQTTEIHALQLELTGLRSELEITGENHSAATNLLTAALKERENALETLKQEHESSRITHENKISDVQSAYNEVARRASDLESEIAKVKQDFTQSENKFKQANKALEDIKSEHKSKLEMLHKQLDETNTQVSEARAQLSNSQRQKKALEATAEAAKKELTSCKQGIESLQESVNTLKANLELSQQELATSDEKLLSIMRDREETEKNLRGELERAESSLKKALSEVSDLKMQVAQAQKKEEVLSANQVPEDELQSLRDHMKATEDKYEAEVKQFRKQIQDSENRLARQLDAFNTIRGELTTVRERQLDREDEIEQKMQSKIDELQLDLTDAYEKRKLAEDKLAQNGLSPVSERGFWVSDDGQTDTDLSDDEEALTRNEISTEVENHRSPNLGRIPPLQKPRFTEFHHVPQCSGCMSEAFDI